MIMCMHRLIHYRAALGGTLVSSLCRVCCAGQCPAALRAAASCSGRARRGEKLVSAGLLFKCIFIGLNY